MGMWHNPELRRELLIFLGLSLALGAVGLWASPLVGLCVLCTGLAFTALHLWSLWRRNRQLTKLSGALRNLMNGVEQLPLEDYTEGELSVLRSELQKLLQELKAGSDRLTAEKALLTDALADISHQLRTPLTSMQLMVTLLKDDSLPLQRRRSLCRELDGMLHRTEWLVDALLKLSKLDAGTAGLRQQPTDLGRALRLAADPLSVPLELKNVALVIDARAAVFTGDEKWTAEALGNILKNAMEHTPAGGRIEATVTASPLFAQVLIRDNGPGFSKEDLPHLFERFYRGAGSSENSFGIGLALARRIILAQNGTVLARNAPGGGAEFLIRFYHSVI